MGDWTQGQVTIYACPDKYHDDVLKILVNDSYGLDFDGLAQGPLEIGETYGVHEVAGDNPSTIVTAIVNLFSEDEYTPGRRWQFGDKATCFGCSQEISFQGRDDGHVWLNLDPQPLGPAYGDRQPTGTTCVFDQPHRTTFVPGGDCQPEGLVVVAWTDPAYEWLGELVIQTPVGGYSADCDASGTAYFSADQIRAAIADDTVDVLLGKEVEDYLLPYLPEASR